MDVGVSRNGFQSAIELGRQDTVAKDRRKVGSIGIEALPAIDAGGFVEHFPDAIFLVRQGGTVIYLNEKARRLVLAGYPVLQTVDGKLALAEQGTDLAVSVAAAVAQPPKSTIFVCESNCRPSYQVSVGPSRGRFDSEGALIIVRNLPEMAQMRSKVAEVAYSLTPSEVRVLEALLKGFTPQDVAAITGTKITTVRTQIASVLGKAGVKRQAELMTQVFNLPVI